MNPVGETGTPHIDPAVARLNLALPDVPLGEALTYVAGLADLKVRVEEKAVQLVPAGAQDPLITKEWKNSAATARLGRTPQQSLATAGVPFPTDAAASWSADGARLTVRNTAENLELVEAVLSGKPANSRLIDAPARTPAR